MHTYNYPLSSGAISNLYQRFVVSVPGLAGGGGGGGSLQSPPGESLMDGGGAGLSSEGLYLVLQPAGPNVRLILYGTVPDAVYSIYSKENLLSGPWKFETTVIGAAGEDQTDIYIPKNGRQMLFLRAGSADDFDGDGLSDAEEAFLTGTDPANPDTGNTGIADGYKDADGDQWTHIDEIRNGSSPNAWDEPPAPFGLHVTSYVPDSSASLDWEPSSGPVIEYVIERDNILTPAFEEIARVPANVTEWVDAHLSGVSPAGLSYRVRAQYAPGYSAYSNLALPEAVENGVQGAVVRGPQGRLYLVASKIPQNVTHLRIRRDATSAFYPLFEFTINEDFGSLDPISDGHVDIPVSALGADGAYLLPASDIPAYGRYRLYMQPITSTGVRGPETWVGPFVGDPLFWNNNIPFLDGAVALKQNLLFLLRAARGGDGNPLRFGIHNDYVNADYYHSYEDSWGDRYTRLNEFNPFQANYLYRNWVFSENDIVADASCRGCFATGVGFDAGTIGDAKYKFDVFNFVSSGNQSLLTGQMPGALMIYLGYAEVNSVTGLEGYADLPNYRFDNSGMVDASGQLSLASPFTTTLGALFQRIRISRYGWPSIDYRDVVAGSSIMYPGDGEFFQEVAAPTLTTFGYHFDICDFGDGQRNIFPGHPSFDMNAPARLIIASVGKPIRIAGWAKQSINGNQSKIAYLGQYFDKAYKANPDGTRSTQETGILSEYGEFFPTEPGRVILTTKPDPDQGGMQGECLVYVIKMELDVNHDGDIDRTFHGPDNTSAAKPFRFWLNNDSDGTGVGSEGLVPQAGGIDSTDNDIKSQRDLEDFARLWISGVPAMTDPSMQVSIRWRNASGPTIRLFRAYEADGGTKYLTDQTVAQSTVQHANLSYVYTLSPSTTFEFPASIFTPYGRKHFMFEGVSEGAGELVLTVSKAEVPMAETSVWVDLRKVRDMFDHVHIDGVLTDFPAMRTSTTVSTFKTDSEAAYQNEAKQFLVHIHGWNNTLQEAENYAETMFKRLYWQGYQGRFAALRWSTWTGVLSYNTSEYVAFRSGAGLSAYFDALRSRFPEYLINASAHSMGNIVMMEALKLQLGTGARALDNYVLLEAAVPAHCYDVNVPGAPGLVAEELQHPTPNTYAGYPGAINGTLAPGGKMANFFNENDFALSTWGVNHRLQKPDGGLGYYIAPNVQPYRLPSTLVTDVREIMAFCARSRSFAVGAQPEVHGAILGPETDLGRQFGFGDALADHSGQFTRTIQNVWNLYTQIGIRLNIIQPAP